mmetsp:Transcript_1352/g.4049  ORF Transcript_1352/g.4049 Transcript_1352/m.4049 type:complete len:118 (-) Transcript_1352:40-393(-)
MAAMSARLPSRLTSLIDQQWVEKTLRSAVRQAYWVAQPYRTFADSRVTVAKTRATTQELLQLPAKTSAAAVETAHAVNGARLRMWSFYCRNPLTICGSVLAAYGLGSAVVANAPNRK